MDSTASPSQNDRTHQRRTVNRLSPGKLAHKRANDRIAKQKIRKRDLEYVKGLEQKIIELEDQNIVQQEHMEGLELKKECVEKNDEGYVTEPDFPYALHCQ